jgi:hypothetical protein
LIIIHKNFEIMHLFSILSFLTCLVLINADYLPVLSNINTNKEITIGQAVSFDSILSNLKSNQNLQVIIVDNVKYFFNLLFTRLTCIDKF